MWPYGSTSSMNLWDVGQNRIAKSLSVECNFLSSDIVKSSNVDTYLLYKKEEYNSNRNFGS